MSSIFVQIASYRDPEIKPTIQSILSAADNAADITIGVCWQGSADDLTTLPLRRIRRCRFMMIHNQESKGIGWARHQAMKLYEAQDYILQLDSHHRMEDSWDTILFRMLDKCSQQSSKPLLTSYLPGYARAVPAAYLAADHFDADGLIHLITGPAVESDRPVPGGFISAHFIFSKAQFFLDVPPDPQMAFLYEESSMAPRAYTHGYDIFYPNEVIGGHQWDRKWRKMDWDDHDRTAAYALSRTRYQALLGVGASRRQHFFDYGLGTVRSLEAYQYYSGVNFQDLTITEAARRGLTS